MNELDWLEKYIPDFEGAAILVLILFAALLLTEMIKCYLEDEREAEQPLPKEALR